ncbi:MAG TPA: cysteine desulfurase NifS [Dehalococcoidia bacterium]|jgi:cysteine desulfurase
MQRIYLDNAATTPTHPDVVKAMLPYFTEAFGNPSSLHSYGQEAKDAVERARAKVASLIGAKTDEIVFTGSGTEADNFALNGVASSRQTKGNHIITTLIEHHAVLETCKFLERQGFSITYLPVDGHGLVDPEDVKNAITGKTILISIMHANNECGTIEPIAEIGAIAQEAGVYLHTDAVQTVGHIPVNVSKFKVNLLSISAHKLYGPKGVGALYIKKGTRISPFIHGGSQERGRRASTENVPGIVGLGRAAEIAEQELTEEADRLTALRDRLIEGILGGIEYTQLNGHPVKRLPNNANVSINYIEGESVLLNLDLEGICASTGSACTSEDLQPSHVLVAMGMPHLQAHSSLRFSLGKWTAEDDINRVLNILPGIVSKLRAMSPLMKTANQ